MFHSHVAKCSGGKHIDIRTQRDVSQAKQISRNQLGACELIVKVISLHMVNKLTQYIDGDNS